MKIAVCDDNRMILRKIHEEIDRCLDAIVPEKKPLVHIYEYENGSSLLDAHVQVGFDVVFLDVEMPGLNGVEVARSLREYGSDVIIIIISSYAKYALQGYQYDAYRYVLKSNMESDLPKVLFDALQKYRQARKHPVYQISYRRQLRIVPYGEIVCVCSRRRGSIVTTIKGVYEDSKRQDEAWAELGGCSRFVRVNAYTIINADYISAVKGTSLVLSYLSPAQKREIEIEVRVGKNKMPDVKKRCAQYYSEAL